jgi:hypothetical protein
VGFIQQPHGTLMSIVAEFKVHTTIASFSTKTQKELF